MTSALKNSPRVHYWTLQDQSQHSMLHGFLLKRTEDQMKGFTWLGDISSHSCLSVLTGPAWQPLNIVCTIFSQCLKCERGSLLSGVPSLSLSFSATNFSPGTAIDSSGLNQILSDRLWEAKDPVELQCLLKANFIICGRCYFQPGPWWML